MLVKRLPIAAAMALAFAATPAMAQDGAECPAGLVCASEPQTVVDALERAGLEPELGTDDQGDPKIVGQHGNWTFNLFFYDCVDNADCKALQFEIAFNNDDGLNTLELANEWNRTKRFGQLSLGENDLLNFSYDVTAVGGLTQDNFADVADWWIVLLDGLSDFFMDHGA
ncbi:hypothetical protein WYH_00867 [Croceibacterium atlanticum]|uniref:YbjN domain-containing protein n=1 Tax=Croceibacterium atlanticum TaxID=1267766 RepID=A0A0F7KN08_9SPHN|nr:hypothetical protein WYH_00867 [Croceibacterium atlanticum]